MIKNMDSSNELLSKKVFKRRFTFGELYRTLVFVPKALSILMKNTTSKLVDKNFIERLQLAVTEVNGCPACSYQHTKIALRQGMSNEEIHSFLRGWDQFITPQEGKAILFAQHFAESRWFPKKYAYQALIKEYGEKQANIIFSAVQIMLAGNMYGIPYSAFQSRITGQTYVDSSLFYELGMLFGGFIILPIAIINGLINALFGMSNKRFDTDLWDG